MIVNIQFMIMLHIVIIVLICFNAYSTTLYDVLQYKVVNAIYEIRESLVILVEPVAYRPRAGGGGGTAIE